MNTTVYLVLYAVGVLLWAFVKAVLWETSEECAWKRAKDDRRAWVRYCDALKRLQRRDSAEQLRRFNDSLRR